MGSHILKVLFIKQMKPVFITTSVKIFRYCKYTTQNLLKRQIRNKNLKEKIKNSSNTHQKIFYWYVAH